MKIYIPSTKIQPATYISLRNYEYEVIPLKGEAGYSEYFKQRWVERESFINVEHDSVLWPGAIDSLENCLGTWCAFDYSSTTNWSWEQEHDILHSIQLGCMKITSYVIDHTPDIWDKPIDWSHCDVHLFDEAVKANIKIHQHFPGIVNANPMILSNQ